MLLCGIDEAGRGPLAGPVAAAAVILGEDFPMDCLGDSKKLSQKKRLYAEGLIKERALWGVGFASHGEIDRVNVLQATMLAMGRAFGELLAALDRGDAGFSPGESIRVIADGPRAPPLSDPRVTEVLGVVKADASVPQVMAASILAKCARDRLMEAFALEYPAYGYDRHKGYPTAAHREICRRLGPSPIQRRTFRY
ncbi:MAG: ribonuclease HII [Spirochaetaceae bacterium]|jgi:ribonuclease HII|nr:ribonuclease HII [Spirochaetaceae bacterium]